LVRQTVSDRPDRHEPARYGGWQGAVDPVCWKQRSQILGWSPHYHPEALVNVVGAAGLNRSPPAPKLATSCDALRPDVPFQNDQLDPSNVP